MFDKVIFAYLLRAADVVLTFLRYFQVSVLVMLIKRLAQH